jgi:hypothetical protein
MPSGRLEKLLLLEEVTRLSIADAPADKRASLIAQMRGILAEIEVLQGAAGKVGDPLDEITARRTARGGATARARRAEGGAG